MNFLRPVYTEYLFKQLQKQSLNVYGSAGQGRERLLEDLQTLAKPLGILVLTANMKEYAKNHQGFIKHLSHQLASQLSISDASLSLEQLINQHSQQKTVWILLHQFDAVLNNTHLDKQFGIAFFNQLNALKNRSHCSLLCVTERPFRQYRFYTEQIHSLSPLDLELDELTPLTQNECEQELQRRALGLADEHFRLLLARVYSHCSPYLFLEYACNRIAAGADNAKPFKHRLAIWQEHFKQQYKRGVLTGLEKLRNKMTIVTRELKLLILAISGLAAVVGVIYAKGQHIWDWILQHGIK